MSDLLPNSGRVLTVASHEVLLDIETLGASLDGKISDFVKLLIEMKNTGQPKLIGTVSKLIHELTEDTRRLSEIKSRLEVD
jgi:hypothetical protein